MLRESSQSAELPCLPEVDQDLGFCNQTAQLIENQFVSPEQVEARENLSGICLQRLKLHRVGQVALTGTEAMLLRAVIQ